MKVSELIELLSKCNPNADIKCQYYEGLLPGSDEPEPQWFTPTWTLELPKTIWNAEGEVWIRE